MGLGKWKSRAPAATTPGAPSNAFVSRKQQRKDAKKLKKLQNLAFSKRQKVESVITESLNRDDGASKKKKKRKAKKERREEEEELNSDEEIPSQQAKKRKHNDSESDSDEDITYEQYLKEVEEKSRERLANAEMEKEDDIAIHRYSKLLGIDKRKSKNVPKSFCDEGLDGLLEFCDAENRKDLISKEENLDIKGEDIDDEEEEEGASDGEPEIDLSEGEDNIDDDSDVMDEDGMFDEEEMEDEEAGEESEDGGEAVTEDIYGRTVDKRTGELIKFDPKAARRKLEELESKKGGDDETRMKIDRTITGIINRLSEATLIKSKQMFLELWTANPKNDVKSSLTKILWKMMGAPYRLQDSLISTYTLFLGIIHATIGSEISAYFVEEFLVDYVKLLNEVREQDDKAMENRIILIANLANFRIMKPSVILELIDKLIASFTIDNLQLLFALGTYSYKTMKRQCWTAFCEKITDALNKLQTAPIGAAPRAKFLGEQLTDLKKAPPASVDLSVTEHHQKMLHGLLKKEKGEVEKELGMGLEDLLKAEERGRWWIVGSAFRLANDSYSDLAQNRSDEKKGPSFPQDLVDLAIKAKMNTAVRRNIFCTIASASDEDEAFEKLLRLSLKGQQEREIIIVIVQMMLKEKQFNAYYPSLVARFCNYDRRFILTTQYAIWDRIREVGALKPKGRGHLAQFIHNLIYTEVMHITVLKVVEWGTMDAATSSMLRRVFTLLSDCAPAKFKRILQPLLIGKKDPVLTEGLRLFLQINFPSTPLYQAAETWFCGL